MKLVHKMTSRLLPHSPESVCIHSSIGFQFMSAGGVNKSFTYIFILLLFFISSAHTFEVRLASADPGGTIVNFSLPGQNWNYALDTKHSKFSLPFIYLNHIHSGAVQAKKKINCLQSKNNPMQFSILAKTVFNNMETPEEVSASFPFSVFLEGQWCKIIHRHWLREKLKRNHNHVKINITVPSSDSCFTQGRTILSLYDFIPLNFHKCKIHVNPLSSNIIVNHLDSDISFSHNVCVKNGVKAKIEVSIACHKSENQLMLYVIAFKKHTVVDVSPSVTTKKPLRKKRQTRNKPPTFAQAQYTKNVKEEQDPGLSVIKMSATDPDEGEAGVLTYKMEANADLRSLDMFAINPASGLVNTTKRLDRETMASHSFKIIATDNAMPESERRSATALLFITVDDVNDHAPTFPSSSARIEISENRDANQEVYVAKAVDGDTGDNAVIKYSILNQGPPNDAFYIEPLTGSISTRVSLDREKVSSYKLIILAIDQGDINDRKTSTFTLSINVADVNDNSPQFLQDSYAVNIREDQAVSTTKEIINVTATDADEGVNSQISYRLSGQVQDKFSIDKYSGKLCLIGPLDYEDVSSYQLNVWAEDQGNPPRRTATNVIVTVIDVNDNSPAFYDSSYKKTVDENLPIGTSILQTQADDRDSGNNALITFSILNPTNPFPFQIDPRTGWIKTTGQLDRETQSSYTFIVQAQDNGDKPLGANVTVVITLRDLNDNPPIFQARSYNASISEEANKGDQVVTVVAIDADEGDNARITYSIDRGNDKDAFQIRLTNGAGIITVNKKLDARDQNKYVLAVSATDKDGFSDSIYVYIDVLDTNRFPPEFQTNPPYSFDVKEDVDIGTSVFSVLAIDRDRGENARITYSLDPSSVFSIDPDTGVIQTRQKLDRETVSVYMLIATATDNGKPPQKEHAEIAVTVKDVNDNKPEFQKVKYFGKVSEDALKGVKILNVTATDKDEGVNGQVRYTFDNGNDGNGAFSIDNQGWIRLAKEVDRETTPSYDLVVVAVDSDPVNPQSASVVVHIDVEDVNDNAPIFQFSVFTVSIPENSPIGSTVDVISAVDPDEGVNALINYTIANGADSSSFKQAGRLGDPAIIVTLINLDYEGGKQQYEITLIAASITLISSAKIIINVQDVNDNSPVLEDFSIIYNNFDGMFPSGPIGRIPAYDPDVCDRDRLIYKILSGNKADLLYLNETSGEVTLNPKLNSDVPRTGTFQISVTGKLHLLFLHEYKSYKIHSSC